MRNKNDNSKFKRLKIKDLLNKFRFDSNILKSFIALNYGLTFRDNGRCEQSDAVSIVLNKLTGYYLVNHNPAKIAVPNGGLSAQLLQATKTTTGAARAAAQYEILEGLGIDTTTGAAGMVYATTGAPVIHSTGQPVSGAGHGTAQARPAPIWATWESGAGAAVLSYFFNKTGATVQSLEKFNIKPIQQRQTAKGLTITHTPKRPAFAYLAGGCIKIKQPQSGGKKFFDWIAPNGAGAYIFGGEQMPAQGELCLICAGEDDALCVNAHHDPARLYAISLGGENRQFPEAFLMTLKSRFKRLLILFDSDKAGTAAAVKMSQKTGIEAIDAPFLFGALCEGTKDICNVYEKSGAAGVIELCSAAAGLNSDIKTDKDPFSIDVKGVINCNFNQYLTEQKPLNYILKSIELYKRVAIQSPAGTGKSFAGAKIAIYARAAGFSGSLFLTPTKAITEQLYNSLQSQFEAENSARGTVYSAAGLWGRVTKYDIEAAAGSTVIVSTYDKIATALQSVDFQNYLIVVDEFHQIISDFGYRARACRAVWDLIATAPAVVLLSATPNLLFCSNLQPIFNYKLLRFFPKITNSIDIQIITHNTTKSDVLGSILDFRPQIIGTHCIKFDNNKNLSAFGQHFNKVSGATALHFTSQDPTKEQNAIYQSIMQSGGAGMAAPELMTYTSLFEAGVSFCFAVGLVSIMDARAAAKIIQHSTRPRLQADGTNQKVNIQLFIKESKPFEVTETAENKLKRLIKNAEKSAFEANYYHSTGGTDDAPRSMVDINFGILLKNGTYLVDLQAILYEIFASEEATATPELIELRIKKLDPRFNFVQAVDFGIFRGNLIELIKAARALEAGAAAELDNIATTEPAAFLQAIGARHKDPQTKQRIKELLKIQSFDKDLARATIERAPAAFALRYAFELCGAIMELCDMGQTLKEAAAAAVLHGSKEVKIMKAARLHKERVKDVKRALTVAGAPVNGGAVLQTAVFFEVRTKLDTLLDNATRGKRTNQFTAKELCQVVNDAIKAADAGRAVKMKTEKTAIDYVRTVFEIEQKRTKKARFYRLIGRVKTT